MNKLIAILICCEFFLLPATVNAYVGPGAGLSLLGALWALIVAVVTALIFILAWPIRRMRRRKREAKESAARESAARESEARERQAQEGETQKREAREFEARGRSEAAEDATGARPETVPEQDELKRSRRQ